MAKSWPSYISSLKGYGHPAGPSWKSPLLKGVTTHSANLVPTLDEEGTDCSYKTHRYYPEPSFSTLKPWYSEQVHQTLFVHYRIIHYVKCNMLSKSSEWELGFVHYSKKFTISRFAISRFECTLLILHHPNMTWEDNPSSLLFLILVSIVQSR